MTRRVTPGDRSSFKTYDEVMDEVTRWNVENTEIIQILRGDISDERLLAWSEALKEGIRGVMRSKTARPEAVYKTYLDLYRFIIQERIKLANEPSMKKAKGTEDLDPITVCIVCGIRYLQKQFGMPGLLSTMRLKLLQRYLELPAIGPDGE